ncbi:hypothetical protein [Streptomyces sp. NBC_00525]|uniref:hypothetical protein n=1 Tax=Streptomyces sp. NBC_00525 TaxID=2903660 RepID=UPI002E81E7E7|nr:hypothetical protein [Streptomyces sp. NBC_00525]WUC97479.1 hypothetical protein OG710_29390 [Streptomyces sp. NBC_00525]
MSLTSQILPLAGVVLGAVTSFVVTSTNERTRWRRQQAARWDDRRLTAYADYAHVVKELAAHYQRLAAGRGLTTGPIPAEATPEVLAEVAQLESRRSALSESLGLLGDTDANTASKSVDRSLWRLEALARGVDTSDDQDWGRAYLQFRQARDHYVERARASLGVPGSAGRPVPLRADRRPAQPPGS